MNRKLVDNLVSLYAVQALNYALPLFTLPFLARVLGAAHWGELAFAEAYATYVSFLVEYGFSFSATREVSQARHDANVRAHQLAGVIGAQFLLSTAALLITFILSFTVHAWAQYRPLLPFACLLAIGRAIIPFWYFQALERMRFIAVLNVISNLAAAGVIFGFVRGPSQTWIPLVARACAMFVSAAVAYTIAFRETPFLAPRVTHALRAFKEGSSLFLFSGAVTLYSTANVLVLGLLSPATVVAFFAGAEKIAKASVGLMTPISQTFYPRITYLLKEDPRKAMETARLSLLMTVGVATVAGLAYLIGAPLLVRMLLGPGFQRSVPVLRILAILPPIIAASIVLGLQWMVPLRMDWIYSRLVLSAGVLNIVLACLLVPRYQEIGMATSVVIAEALVAGGIIVLLMRRNLQPWRPLPENEELPVNEQPITSAAHSMEGPDRS